MLIMSLNHKGKVNLFNVPCLRKKKSIKYAWKGVKTLDV